MISRIACLLAMLACGCKPSGNLVPPYDLVEMLTTLSADDAILVATKYCDENEIDLRFRQISSISYDTLDGTGFWYVLYMGETHTVGSRFGWLVDRLRRLPPLGLSPRRSCPRLVLSSYELSIWYDDSHGSNRN